MKRVMPTPTGAKEAAGGLLALNATYQAEDARIFVISVCTARTAHATNRFLRSSDSRAKIAVPRVAVLPVVGTAVSVGAAAVSGTVVWGRSAVRVWRRTARKLSRPRLPAEVAGRLMLVRAGLVRLVSARLVIVGAMDGGACRWANLAAPRDPFRVLLPPACV